MSSGSTPTPAATTSAAATSATTAAASAATCATTAIRAGGASPRIPGVHKRQRRSGEDGRSKQGDRQARVRSVIDIVVPNLPQDVFASSAGESVPDATL